MAGDIFDDVNEILDMETTEEDKNFNESELQDIMSEIEDLEKEFVSDEAPIMSLQEKIDAEMAMGMEETPAEVFEETFEEETFVAAATPKADILTFEKTTPKTTPTFASKSEVGFEARGQMTLNLDFKVGEETAKLSVDPVKGLIVTLSGVELCISEDSGCTVSMDNGMKFTIPLSSQTISHKKKTA